MNVLRKSVVSLAAQGEIEARPDGGTACNVREFALLSDGSEVTLWDGRGWTSSAPLEDISLAQVVRNIYNVTLPDNAEQTGDSHEWHRFEQVLREAGHAVSKQELQSLPYSVMVIMSGGWPDLAS